MVRGSWQVTVHRVTQSQTRLKWLSIHAIVVLISLKETDRRKSIRKSENSPN